MLSCIIPVAQGCSVETEAGRCQTHSVRNRRGIGFPFFGLFNPFLNSTFAFFMT